MKKITLGAALAGKATHLLFYCATTNPKGITCGRNGQMPLEDAIERWGDAVALDRVPARCERCGSRDVDVRPYYPPRPGGPPLL